MRGLVYKSDSQKDLALVKLATSARGSHNLAALALAVALPKVSSDCVAIGHPSSGHLWSVRNGVIAGTGNWPRDHIDWTMEKLRLTSDTARRELEELVKRLPQRKVILSTCGINHGDSGGPLVDAKGDLIGVTFGIPAAVEDNKFAYHIHLDEVRNFLKDVTATPPLHVPSPWPPSALGASTTSTATERRKRWSWACPAAPCRRDPRQPQSDELIPLHARATGEARREPDLGLQVRLSSAASTRRRTPRGTHLLRHG